VVTGWRVATLLDVVRRLRAASPGVTGRPRVIAVDVLRPRHRGRAVDFRPDAWIARDRPGSIIVAGPAHLAHDPGTELVVAPPTG
jgi:hypothetical protein